VLRAASGAQVLPTAIGDLTNVTSLRLHHNRLCCLPRELVKMRKLAKLSVEGNHISIVPTELGLLTTLNALTYDTKTFLPVPSEIFNLGQDSVLQFLQQACCPHGLPFLPAPSLRPQHSCACPAPEWVGSPPPLTLQGRAGGDCARGAADGDASSGAPAG
jgi:hypothetical protein